MDTLANKKEIILDSITPLLESYRIMGQLDALLGLRDYINTQVEKLSQAHSQLTTSVITKGDD